jgi:hypothetical protein
MAARPVNLREVARWQRKLLWLVLAIIVLNVLFLLPMNSPAWVPAGILILSLVVQISAIVCVLQVQAAMGVNIGMRMFTAVLMFLPCVSLLVLLSVDVRASGLLKKAGLKVGLLGVDPDEADRVLTVGLCNACGYQLEGNVSGACPECGAPTG